MTVIEKDTIKSKAAAIGERLMWFRKLNQLNQKEFSESINTTQASVSQIESGKSIPDGTFFIKLIAAYPMNNLHWLFLGIEKPLREMKNHKAAMDENEKRIKALNEYFGIMSAKSLRVMTSVEMAKTLAPPIKIKNKKQ
jgi:transcriptional regulator with XRE-family HTH domain